MIRFPARRAAWLGVILLLSPLAVAFMRDASTGSGNESSPSATDPSSTPPPPAVVSSIGGVLSRAGLSAEALAAVGVPTGTVASVASNVSDELEGDASALASADVAFQSAKMAHEVMRRRVRSGVASPAEVAECQTRLQTCQDADAARSDLLDRCFDAGTSGLTAAQQQKLATLRANRTWRLPTQYLVVDRSEADWVALRDALATKRISENYGGAFPNETQQLLANIDALPDVASASVGIDTNLAAIQTAWNIAVDD